MPDGPATSMTVTARLAATVAWLRTVPLDPAIQEAVARAVTDWLAAAVGGSGEPAPRALASLTSGGGPSRIVGGGGLRADPSVAALVNGTAAHVLEVDDIFAPGLVHPGAPVVAAALAVADATGAGGESFVRAVVAGYEVCCRVAQDLGPEHYAHWHTTGTAGALGAAAAAAELWGLGDAELAHALGLAATMASGLQQTFRRDAMGKPLHAGHAAQAGVVAAAAARGGVTAAPDALEGEAGLALATGAASSWTRSAAEPGGPLAIEQVTVKPYPCCGHTFAVIDAVLALRESGVVLDDVEAVTVETYGTAIDVAGIESPVSPAERRFSIPFALVAAWRDGLVGRETFESPLAGHAPAVTMVAHADFDEPFPERRGARVRAVTHDGRVHEWTVPDRSGSPQNPVSSDRIDAKYLALATAVLGEVAADQPRRVRLLAGGGDVDGLALG